MPNTLITGGVSPLIKSLYTNTLSAYDCRPYVCLCGEIYLTVWSLVTYVTAVLVTRNTQFYLDEYIDLLVTVNFMNTIQGTLSYYPLIRLSVSKALM